MSRPIRVSRSWSAGVNAGAMVEVISVPDFAVVTFNGRTGVPSADWAPIPWAASAVPGSSGNAMDGQITPTKPIGPSRGSFPALALMSGNIRWYSVRASAAWVFQPWLNTNRSVTPDVAISPTSSAAGGPVNAPLSSNVTIQYGRPSIWSIFGTPCSCGSTVGQHPHGVDQPGALGVPLAAEIRGGLAEQRLDLLGPADEFRPVRQERGDHSRDVGGGHRGAGLLGVGERRVDAWIRET